MNQRMPSGSRWPPTPSAPPSPAARPPEAMGNQKDSTTSAAGRVLEELENFIGKHPAACLAAAATCGVLIGWLAKRRV